jgi:uncharacterized OB-fold protein
MKIGDDLILRFEGLKIKETEENQSEVIGDLVLPGKCLMRKCRNCGAKVIRLNQDCKHKTQQNGGKYGNSENSAYISYQTILREINLN